MRIFLALTLLAASTMSCDAKNDYWRSNELKINSEKHSVFDGNLLFRGRWAGQFCSLAYIDKDAEVSEQQLAWLRSGLNILTILFEKAHVADKEIKAVPLWLQSVRVDLDWHKVGGAVRNGKDICVSETAALAMQDAAPIINSAGCRVHLIQSGCKVLPDYIDMDWLCSNFAVKE